MRVALVVGALLVAAAAAAQGWRNRGNSARMDYRTTDIGPTKPVLLWSHDAGYSEYHPVAVTADQSLLLVNDVGELEALHPNGSLRWRSSAMPSTAYASAPMISIREDGTVFIYRHRYYSQPTFLTAINGSTGGSLWRYKFLF